jgi:hypothetical protein
MQSKQVTVGFLSVAALAAGLAFSSASTVLADGALADTEPVAPSSETSPGDSQEGVTVEEPGGRERQVVLYYFHGARRCKTCLSMEANALDVVKSEFAKELDSGALVWKVVNYDEPENEHFIKDFSLVSSSLVLVEMHQGERVRFDVLQRAWSLARDEWRFQKYVHESVLGYLG